MYLNRYDVLVKYGINENEDEHIDDNEKVGEYEVYGMSKGDYENATLIINLGLIGQAGLGQVGFEYLKSGTFSNSIFGNYNPDVTEQVQLDADRRLTHKLGAPIFRRTGQPTEIINGIEYRKHKAVVERFIYNNNSDAADDLAGDSNLKAGLRNHVRDTPYATIATLWSNGSPVSNASPNARRITLSAEDARFDFGFTGYVTFGKTNIDTGTPYHGSGSIELIVTKINDPNDPGYLIGSNYDVNIRIDDLTDFNYFKPSWAGLTGGPRSGATYQSGQGKPFSAPNSGKICIISVKIDRVVSVTPDVFKRPPSSP